MISYREEEEKVWQQASGRLDYHWASFLFSSSFFCLSVPSSRTLLAPLLPVPHFVYLTAPESLFSTDSTPPHPLIRPHFTRRLRLTLLTNPTPIWVSRHASVERRSHRNVTIHLGWNLWQPVSVGQPGLNPQCECVCLCVCVT